MKINGQNISMIRGDSESITVSCNDSKGLPILFADGDTIYFTVKENPNTDIKMLQKIITTFTNGKAIIEIVPEDTKTLKFKSYVYDIQWNKADGTVTTIIPVNDFVIEKEVTYE